MSKHDDEPSVDELGEKLAELLRLNQEEVAAVSRISERVDQIHERLVTGTFPFLPPRRHHWKRDQSQGGAG